MTKVSIIIPVYNTERYLKSCLDSVCNQTEEDLEILCIHDHSTDHSLEMLKEYEKRYPYKMKVFDLVEKRGLSAARNEGLSHANGEFIGFVDSDDLVSLNLFGDFYRYAKEYNVDIVIGNSFRIASDAYLNGEFFLKEESQKPRLQNYLKINRLFFNETPAVWDKLFRHDFLEGTTFLENHIYEDVSFTYPLLLKAKETLEVLREDYAYRKTPGSIMNKQSIFQSHILDIFDSCSFGMQKAKLWNFSARETSLLEEVYKNCLCTKIFTIGKWNLKERDKNEIFQKMISFSLFLFPDLFQFPPSSFQNSILEWKKGSYETILNEQQFVFQKNSLERKLKHFESFRKS